MAVSKLPAALRAGSANHQALQTTRLCKPPGFCLRRAECRVRLDLPAASRNARALDVQAVAFFKDAQAALAFMLRCAGASRSAKARALLDQLAPVMRASATCWKNERAYLGAARKQREALRASQRRRAVRDDLVSSRHASRRMQCRCSCGWMACSFVWDFLCRQLCWDPSRAASNPLRASGTRWCSRLRSTLRQSPCCLLRQRKQRV